MMAMSGIHSAKFPKNVQKFLDNLSNVVLGQFYSKLEPRNHVYFIIDTEAGDSSIFEEKIVNAINSNIGKSYVLNFEKIGKGTSFAKTILPLIFLRSDFSVKIAEKCGSDKVAVILQSIRGSGSLFSIAKKFLECRTCSSLERSRLGFEYDLSDDDNALEFFKQCLHLYERTFGEKPAFVLKNLNISYKVMSLNSTFSFFQKIEKLPTAFFLIIPKQSEYCIMPLWDKFTYVRLNKIKHEDIANLIKRTINDEFAFTERGLQLFCRKMRSIHGNEIPATPLITALSDLLSFKKTKGLNKIDYGVVLNFFSTSFVKVKPPKPKPPSKGKSPYFGNEIERLTTECRKLGLDPNKALPYSFRCVLWHMRRGNIKYSKNGDFFVIQRYLGLQEFKKLARALNELGYKKTTGTGKWVFSPKN
jgi:hypothetical protein